MAADFFAVALTACFGGCTPMILPAAKSSACLNRDNTKRKIREIQRSPRRSREAAAGSASEFNNQQSRAQRGQASAIPLAIPRRPPPGHAPGHPPISERRQKHLPHSQNRRRSEISLLPPSGTPKHPPQKSRDILFCASAECRG